MELSDWRTFSFPGDYGSCLSRSMSVRIRSSSFGKPVPLGVPLDSLPPGALGTCPQVRADGGQLGGGLRTVAGERLLRVASASARARAVPCCDNQVLSST